jgi:hypothetical protein
MNEEYINATGCLNTILLRVFDADKCGFSAFHLYIGIKI